jgi:hypothetical protein
MTPSARACVCVFVFFRTRFYQNTDLNLSFNDLNFIQDKLKPVQLSNTKAFASPQTPE